MLWISGVRAAGDEVSPRIISLRGIRACSAPWGGTGSLNTYPRQGSAYMRNTHVERYRPRTSMYDRSGVCDDGIAAASTTYRDVTPEAVFITQYISSRCFTRVAYLHRLACCRRIIRLEQFVYYVRVRRAGAGELQIHADEAA